MRFPRAFVSLLALTALAACAPPDGAPGERLGSQALAGTSCAPAQVLEGIDISYFQSNVDFNAVKASGRAFVITRVSDGLGFIDPTFDSYYAGIQAAGMVRGAYQYFEPTDDPIAQADLLLSHIGSKLSPGDLPPTIDMEKMGTGLSGAQITAGMKAWLDHVEQALGVKPIIYTGAYYWTGDMGDPQGFQDYPLWIAGYPCNFSAAQDHSYCPKIPDQWSGWQFWQYSDGAKQSCASDGVTPPGVDGVMSGGCDRDYFVGSLAELMALAGGGTGAGGSGAGGSSANLTYAAKYVAQSWPLSSAPAIQLQTGQTMTGSIDLKNTGTATWMAGNVMLAPIPRDQPSAFQSPSWPSATRVSSVAADVAPGQTGHFEWDITPSQVGDFSPYFGLVAEGITWFADSGGPPDNDIQIHVIVTAGPGVGAGGSGPGAGGSGPSQGGSGPGAGGAGPGAGGSGPGPGGAGPGAGGSGPGAGGTSAGAGGSKMGAGGSGTAGSPAAGPGGASSGAAGATAGAGGMSTGAGGKAAGAGGKAGGSAGGAAKGGAAGAAAAVGAGGAAGVPGDAGVGGSSSDAPVVQDIGNSDSSGGCSAAPANPPSPRAWLGVGLALAALSRRRRQDRHR